MTQVPGTLFEHYEIRSLLGKGGMGEVYLAYDTVRGREVALKLLPAEFANDAERLRRFAQEAFAAATLSSDHFTNIYEIGQADSAPFLAMEFIDGVTLRRHLKLSHMSVAEALGVAAQLAEALRVAHRSGIVHRDIKPENIMLCGDNRIKVLDLGLAKLTEAFHRLVATPEALTMTNLSTGQGTVIGTVNYMSPEQLRGHGVDERTDIWSLGVVLYEMLSGELPFRGRGPEEVVVSILEREPSPLAQFRPNIPFALEQVVERLLRKNRDERYQTAREVLQDLAELSGKTGRIIERYHAMPSDTQGGGGITDDFVAVETASANGAAHAREMVSSGIEKSTESVAPGTSAHDLKRHRLKALLLLSLLLPATGGIGYLTYRAFKGVPGTEMSRAMKLARVSMPGEAREAALSPDGSYVVAVMEDAGQQSLVLRELAGASPARLVGPDDKQYMGLTFSPDGRYVYYLEREQETGTLFRVPRLGGASQKLLDNVNTPVAFSPNGERFAFVRYDMRAQASVLLTAQADGTDERRVATRHPPSSFTLGGFRSSGPAWSPDGRVIACPTLDISNPLSADVVAVNLDDGTERRINANGWSSIERIVWTNDGSGLLMNASDTANAPRQLWLLSYASGQARRITNDPNFYDGIGASSDFNSLVTVKSDQFSTVWLLPAADMSAARQIPNSKFKGSNGITWTPDNRLVYTSNESSESPSIRLMEADGRESEQLISGPGASVQPAVSGDGRHVVFVSYKDGVPHIRRVDADGANPMQLTNGFYEDTPQIMSDGRWVIYHSIHPGRDSIWRVSIDGGAPELLSKVPTLHPVVSPDGETIAGFSRDDRPTALWRISLMPSAGGEPVRWFELPSSIDVTWPTLRWVPDGSALTYVVTVDGVSNIWRQAIDGGPPVKLTDFKEDRIFSFAWSADGKQLACVRGLQTSEVVLVEGFK